jgi:hypothetical protein
MDSIAISYAGELSLWGIETSIIVPGAYEQGTSHFQDAMKPTDTAITEEYEGGSGPYRGVPDKLLKILRILPT